MVSKEYSNNDNDTKYRDITQKCKTNTDDIFLDFRWRPDVTNDGGLRRRRWRERPQFALQGDFQDDDGDEVGDMMLTMIIFMVEMQKVGDTGDISFFIFFF